MAFLCHPVTKPLRNWLHKAPRAGRCSDGDDTLFFIRVPFSSPPGPGRGRRAQLWLKGFVNEWVGMESSADGKYRPYILKFTAGPLQGAP